MIARTMVVLPVPGPPVTTMSFCVTASRIASRWLSANAISIFFSAHPIAASTFTAGSGCGPAPAPGRLARRRVRRGTAA